MDERVELFRTAQQSILTLAARDLLRVWRALDLTDARAATDALLATVPDITAAYGDLSAIAAADLYDDLRAEFGPGTAYRARAAAVAPLDQVQASVRHGVTPLWSRDARYEDALAVLSGSVRRLTLQPARDTVRESVFRDPGGARYVRRPSSTACAWCLMLGSRAYGTDTFTSRRSAGQVVGVEIRNEWTGQITGRTGGVRGSRSLGSQFHDSCRCTVVPVWSARDVPQINRDLAAEWQRVTSRSSDQMAAWNEHIEATRPRQHVKR